MTDYKSKFKCYWIMSILHKSEISWILSSIWPYSVISAVQYTDK